MNSQVNCKKKYIKPELKIHGSVENLTKFSAAVGSAPSGGGNGVVDEIVDIFQQA